MRTLLIRAAELENLVTRHAKATAQNVVQRLIELLDQLDVAIFHVGGQGLRKFVNVRVKHLFDMILMSLSCSLSYLSEQLILTVLSQGFELILQILGVKADFATPIRVLNNE